jgi:uncharacterized metal-binding protein
MLIRYFNPEVNYSAFSVSTIERTEKMRFAQAIISKVLRMYLVSCKVNGQVITLLWITAIKKAWQNSVGGTRTRCKHVGLQQTQLTQRPVFNNYAS